MSEVYDLRAVSPAILRGPVADPAISMLLSKELIAQIKYRQLEMEVQQLEHHMGVLKLQMEMLAKEYNIR